MILIDPSLASANQINLEKQILALGSASNLHLDIEDGNFVPNLTFGMKTVRAVAAVAHQKLDAHLMVTNPSEYIDELCYAGVKQIAVHVEALQYPAVCLQRIRGHGGKAGLAFNCMADIKLALPYVELIDYLLIMTSEPDGGIQEFNPQMLGKIEAARVMFPSQVSVMVDGGIGERELLKVVEAGADAVVMGRAVWSASDPYEQLCKLSNLANGK